MSAKTWPRCAAEGCDRDAHVEVILYDIYELPGGTAEVFLEQDFTCPYLCSNHLHENETRATVDWAPIEPPEGEPISFTELMEIVTLPVGSRQREARGSVDYPYTNRHKAQGFNIYRPLR